MGLWSCLCGRPGDTVGDEHAPSSSPLSSSRRPMYVRVPVRLRLWPDDHAPEEANTLTTLEVTIFMDVRRLPNGAWSTNTSPSDSATRLILRSPVANVLTGEDRARARYYGCTQPDATL